jgi:hypothetical protein
MQPVEYIIKGPRKVQSETCPEKILRYFTFPDPFPLTSFADRLGIRKTEPTERCPALLYRREKDKRKA